MYANWMDAWTQEHLGHELGIPVKQEMDEITLDLVGRTKTQLLRRLVTPANVNRFQLVGTNKFLCVKDIPNGAPVGNKEACENFELEVVGEKNGVDLFHLRTAADHKYLALTQTQSTGPNGWKFRSETNKDNASTFFLVDEQIEFFVVQLFKSPFNTLNNENEVAPFVAGKRSPNICKQPLNVPIWMRIPLNYSVSGTIDGTEHTNLDYVGFDSYTSTQSSNVTTKHAALFHLVYNANNGTFALRFINFDRKTRWLCFRPIPSNVVREEALAFIKSQSCMFPYDL